MTNTREEVAVAEAIERSSCVVKDGIAYGALAFSECKTLAKAAIAASNSKYVAVLVEALKAIKSEHEHHAPAERKMHHIAQEALNNLPEELRG